MPEYRSKLFLAAAGLTVPSGALAQSADEAAAIAATIGYPVVLKAQAAELPHKTEAGGVVLSIADEPALRREWSQMTETLQAGRPGLVLDGVLVEPMAARGLEMIVGARRDPDWGPVLMVGLGGIWAEALKDVRLLPAEVAPDRIAAELGRLRGAALLDGFRGSPPVDRPALIDALMRLAALVRSHPEIEEIEINPLIVYPQGKGAVALDALIVVAPQPVTIQQQQSKG